MKPIFTALAPNATHTDALLALKLFLTPWQWRKGSAHDELKERLEEYCGGGAVSLCASGRTALTLLLESLDLTTGDEVAIQSYSCVAVPNAVSAAGVRPVYVDCEEKSLNISLADLTKKITLRTRALVVQHTFGIPAHINELVAFAKEKNLFLIEDCAHSLGAEVSGRKVGTFGDAAFFSFGRDKVISSVFGGALVVYDSSVAPRVTARMKTISPSPLGWIAQQLFHPIITVFVRATFSFFSFGKLVLWAAKRMHLLSRPVERSEKGGRSNPALYHSMPNALCALALSQWKRRDAFNSHRRTCAAEYDRGLAGLPICVPQVPSTSNPIFLRYTILTDRARDLIRFAAARSIFLGDWYQQPIAPEGVSYPAIGYSEGSCPIAERSATQSVNLPTDIHITPTDRSRIVSCVRNFFL